MVEGDYDGSAAYGAPSVLSAGATAHLLLLVLILILLVLVAGMGFRSGRAAEQRRREAELAKTGPVIFQAVRAPLNVALLATGERVFAPARTVLETIDLYLGPLLAMMGGLVAIQKLRKALNDPKPRNAQGDHGAHGGTHGGGGHSSASPVPAPTPTSAGGAGGQTIIIAAPVAVNSGEVRAGSVCSCGCGRPANQCGRTPTPADEPPGVTAREQALMVREALEALSDYWQEDRVRDQIAKAQKALTITRQIGTVSERAAERAALFSRNGPSPAARAARDPNGRGFPWFKL